MLRQLPRFLQVCNKQCVAEGSVCLLYALEAVAGVSYQRTQAAAAGIHTTACVSHGSSSSSSEEGAETIHVTFVTEKDGKEVTVKAPIGKHLLEVAHDNDIELEGACEASLACSTCHVVVEVSQLHVPAGCKEECSTCMSACRKRSTKPHMLPLATQMQPMLAAALQDEDYFHRIPEPSEDELDMLDLAFGLQETSRLGCQLIATKELDGLRVRIPAATRNFYVDGHVPKPH
eukprot:GHRR01027300.1.p1 GENE.GHRR01027300.1~~GHRR01027300.1.p1  ORF type:complete len:232 (+),score=59.41 GHRR01027300.1:519-1214(+)